MRMRMVGGGGGGGLSQSWFQGRDREKTATAMTRRHGLNMNEWVEEKTNINKNEQKLVPLTLGFYNSISIMRLFYVNVDRYCKVI
jgi:membrane-bound lytic murein transglycosylase MltF